MNRQMVQSLHNNAMLSAGAPWDGDPHMSRWMERTLRDNVLLLAGESRDVTHYMNWQIGRHPHDIVLLVEVVVVGNIHSDGLELDIGTVEVDSWYLRSRYVVILEDIKSEPGHRYQTLIVDV